MRTILKLQFIMCYLQLLKHVSICEISRVLKYTSPALVVDDFTWKTLVSPTISALLICLILNINLSARQIFSSNDKHWCTFRFKFRDNIDFLATTVPCSLSLQNFQLWSNHSETLNNLPNIIFSNYCTMNFWSWQEYHYGLCIPPMIYPIRNPNPPALKCASACSPRCVTTSGREGLLSGIQRCNETLIQCTIFRKMVQ